MNMKHILALVIIISTADALSLPLGNGNSRTKVWDDVLPDEGHRMLLHQHAIKAGLEHKCFSRRPLSKKYNGNNIIERTLDAILSEIDKSDGTTSNQYVEYWTRQEWRHIEAHADVDENLSKQIDQGTLAEDENDLQAKYSKTYRKGYGHRYPSYGHVLYLQVGTDVRGPTCIFPRLSSGFDLKNDMAGQKLEEECSEDDNNRKDVEMQIVPAVAGRLLRFDGRDLHAVPRPSDIWMLPFVKGGTEYDPEDQWERSVILFNVWPGEEPPPLDVPLDENDEDVLSSDHTTTSYPFCNSFANWNEVQISQKEVTSSPTTESNQSVKIWLLGNERRRDHPLRTVPLLAPKEGGRDIVRAALAEGEQVSEIWLRQQ